MPISTPSQITVPFATSGLKNAIPAASNPVTGNAGYDAGFPATNMTPKEAGGIPPFGQDFNGILFDITTAIRYLEAGMQFPYSSSFATAVGGYPLGAIVTRTDGSGFWRNTVLNNTTDPEAFGAGWFPEGSGISSITMSNANITLTALQAARQTIVISGTLTANVNLVFPTYQKQWLIANNATGSFSVTCKTASGGGVTIPTGSSQPIYGDGVNILSSYGSATTVFQGVSRFGTSSEQIAGILSTVMSNPAGVQAFLTSWFPRRSFAARDFIRIPDVPGGLIIQWGRDTNATAGPITVSLHTTFTTAKYLELSTPIVVDPTGWDVSASAVNASLSQSTFNRRSGNGSSTNSNTNFDIFWLAVGY